MTVEKWKRKNPPIRRKPITNADRIRAMSNEELAEWIVEQVRGKYIYGYGDPVQAMLEWLRKECDDTQH